MKEDLAALAKGIWRAANDLMDSDYTNVYDYQDFQGQSRHHRRIGNVPSRPSHHPGRERGKKAYYRDISSRGRGVPKGSLQRDRDSNRRDQGKNKQETEAHKEDYTLGHKRTSGASKLRARVTAAENPKYDFEFVSGIMIKF